MSSIAAELQSTKTPACGSNNQIASALRSNRSSNMEGVSLGDNSAALGLSSHFRPHVIEVLMETASSFVLRLPTPNPINHGLCGQRGDRPARRGRLARRSDVCHMIHE